MLDVGDGQSIYWEVVGQPGRQAGGRPPRRTRQRQQPRPAPLVRPGPLSPDPVRPARLRPEHAARRRPRHGPVHEHDPPPDRRHRAPARAPGHRSMARLGRVLGRDARARLRGAVPGARERDDPAVDHADAPGRRALAGPRDRSLLPRAVGAIPRRRARGRPGRPRRGVRPAAERHGRPGRARSRPRSTGQPGRTRSCRSRRATSPASALGRRAVRGRVRAARDPLLRARRVARGGRAAPQRPPLAGIPARPAPRPAGPLRPARRRVAARAGVARRRADFIPGGHTGDEEMDRLLLEATARFAGG